MAASFQLDIVTPERLAFTEEVLFVTIPGQEGTFGVLPRHAPLLSAVKPGVVQVGDEGDAVFFVVSKGYAEVLPNRVTLLVDDVIARNEIKRDEMEALRGKCSQQLVGRPPEDAEYLFLRNRVEFAEACLALCRQEKPDR
ncbi:MAG: ATP synthase F1 subunit epsilon [Magnetococcales bacterium]|nr:ATP synthase F1 subunit epsilon [Magnetococcales bacterium]